MSDVFDLQKRNCNIPLRVLNICNLAQRIEAIAVA